MIRGAGSVMVALRGGRFRRNVPVRAEPSVLLHTYSIHAGGAMRIVAVALGLVSAFFVFYSVRLLVVTGFLQHTRAGGQGAYIGAVAFPVIAVALAWASQRAWRRGRQSGGAPTV